MYHIYEKILKTLVFNANIVQNKQERIITPNTMLKQDIWNVLKLVPVFTNIGVIKAKQSIRYREQEF